MRSDKARPGLDLSIWALAVVMLLLVMPSNALTAPGLLAQIKAKGKLVAATDADNPPFNFIENGKLVGYSPDLMQYVVRDLEVKLEAVHLPFAGVLPGLIARKYDFISAHLGLTPERAMRFAFTVPISDSTSRLLKRKGDDRIKSLDDLSDKVVGVVLNSASEAALKLQNEKLKEKGLKEVKEVKQFTGYPAAYLALENRTLDGVVDTVVSISDLISKRPDVFEMVPGTVGNPRWGSWATRPDDLDLLDAVNRTLLRLHRTGVMSQLQKKWLGFTVETPTKGYLPPGAVGREPSR